ncbi:MAG: tryptophan 7-halogenase [Alphaproteobacteria bacterium]|nr:tryptophan 7-halogenase [Alphaproteobacteria bacterium]
MRKIQKVVIVGGGTSGWMSAAMLAKAFQGILDITLVESDAIGTIGVGEATIPPIRAFNHFLGLDEEEFVRETKGTYKLAIEFQNWGQVGESYLHGFGYVGRKLGITPFHVFWLKALKEGYAGKLEDYSFNNLACRSGKFAPVEKINNTPLEGLSWAFHFDAGLYAQYLRRYCEAKGVTRVEGKITDVKQCPETGVIDSVSLEGGQLLEGDFFVDCSGFRALLSAGALGSEYEDWSHWLPCDSALAVPSSNKGAQIRPYTQSIAHSAGWQWRIPLQHRTGNGHVYSSSFMDDKVASDILLGNLEGEPLKDPMQLRFKAGCRKSSWVKNCVAIGLSSGFIEPLESTSIHLVQTAVSFLLKHFPSTTACEGNADAFNRRMSFEYETIRDFIILHYHQTARTDSDFWNYVRTMEIPDSLKAKMEDFRSHGYLSRVDDELFTEVGWLQVLVGQGMVPENYNRIGDTVSSPEVKGYLGNLNSIISNAVRQLPTHEAFLKSRYPMA